MINESVFTPFSTKQYFKEQACDFPDYNLNSDFVLELRGPLEMRMIKGPVQQSAMTEGPLKNFPIGP